MSPTVLLDMTATRFRLTGVGRYGLGIAEGLATRRADLLAWDGGTPTPLAGFLAGFTPLPADAPGARPAQAARESGIRTWLRLARRAAYRASVAVRPRLHADLVHALNFFPDARIAAEPLPVLYDLSPLRHPELHPADRRGWFERGLRRIEGARLAVTISAFSAREMVDLLGWPADRIRVIPPAVDPEAFVPSEAPPPFDLTRRGYFLSVATLEPRKNFTTLVEAYGRLPDATRRAFPLVLTGQAGWGDLAWPARTQAMLDAGELRLTGYVDDAALRRLYAGAAGFLYPSTYEGYGMPVAEALACGAPVAVSRGTASVEAGFGQAAEVDALDVEGWTRALAAMAEAAPEEPQTVRDARRAAVAGWTWRGAAAATDAVYAELGAGRAA